jgi:hypothetical protein
MLSGHEDFLGTSDEAGQRLAASGRADASTHGGQRGPCFGSWRGFGGEPRVWSVAKGHCQRHSGNRSRNGAPSRSCSTAGGGTKEDHRPRSPLDGRTGTPDRVGNAGRPGIAAALDLQKHADSGRTVDPAQASSQSYEGRPTSSRSGLQPAKQPQDGRRRRSPRPGCAVPLYRPRCAGKLVTFSSSGRGL